MHTRNDNISELNIEETVIITPRLSQNDHTRKIHRTRIQLKEYRAKIYEKYASLRNSQGFEKELDRPKVSKIIEVPSTPQNSESFWPKETCAIVGDSIPGLKENLLSKNGSIKARFFPGSAVDNMLFNVMPVLKKPTDYMIIRVGTTNATNFKKALKTKNLYAQTTSTLPT